MERSVATLRASLPFVDGKAVGGGFAGFSGDGSPTTQAYGIGHRDTPYDLAELDEFYKGRAENWELIVTPFASPSIFRSAANFGYVPDHFETVLAQIALPGESALPPSIQIEEVVGDLSTWAKVSDAGWSGRDDLAHELSDMAKLMIASPTRRYLASVDGQPAAAASMVSFQGKHLFAGACTLPKFRGKGLQSALTKRRLSDAGSGSLVTVVALPGSQSHRNLQRIGFEPLYSKLVLYRH